MTANVAASVKARLLAKAKADGEEFERTLVRYAAERLLFRLGESDARERCLLKGASLLTVWLPDPYRVTRDVDILAFGASDESGVRAIVEEVCAVPCPEDGLRFDLSAMSVDLIRAEEEYAGRRARFLAYLGKARIMVQTARFGEIGERIIRFLGPIRESLLGGSPFALHWPPAGLWQSAAFARAEERGDD